MTSFGYSYTNPANSQPTSMPYSQTDTAGNTTTYSYDTSNSLTQAIQKNSGGTTLNSYGYGYDPAGNLTSKSVNGTSTTFTYNAADELTQASGGLNRTYTYDGNGDRTASSDGTAINVNAAGQITSITPPGGSAIGMTYTGVGEQERVAAGSTSYQSDGSGLSKQTDSLGDTYFTTTPDGSIISETVPSGANAGTYYYLTDGAGSVVALTDSTGAVRNTYSYDPMGNATTSGSVPNPFTFQGGMYDIRTGYYYTGSGYYDPANGQSFGCQDQGWVDPGEDNCGEDESFANYCQNIVANLHVATIPCVLQNPSYLKIDPRVDLLTINVHEFHWTSLYHLALEVVDKSIHAFPLQTLTIVALLGTAYAVLAAGVFYCRKHHYFVVYEDYDVVFGVRVNPRFGVECRD